MTEQEFNRCIGKIVSKLGNEGEEFAGKLDQIMSLLDEGDQDDCFGTEGWRHHLGWDE